MKRIVVTIVILLFVASKIQAQKSITGIAMNSMVVDSSGIVHIPGAVISPIVPIGKSKYDVWGFVFVQKNYLEIVAGVARNIGNFGFGLAGGPEFVPGNTQARLAATVYYFRGKDYVYGYAETYVNGSGLWYLLYYDRTVSDWFTVGPYIQYESGIGGRLKLTIPKTPISLWGAIGHKGAVLGIELYLEKKNENKKAP